MAFFKPRNTEAKLGERHGKHETIKKVDFSSPLPFCVRVRGDKAALFLRFGSKPDLQLSGLKRSGDKFIIHAGKLSKKTRVRISKLTIRHLPKNIPLNSPVRLPKAPTKKTTTKKITSDDQEW